MILRFEIMSASQKSEHRLLLTHLYVKYSFIYVYNKFKINIFVQTVLDKQI